MDPSLITTVIRVANLSGQTAVAHINYLGSRGLIEIASENLRGDTKKRNAIYFKSTNKGREAIQKYDELLPLFEGKLSSERNLSLRIQEPVGVLNLCKEPCWFNKVYTNTDISTSTLREYFLQLMEMGALRILSKEEAKKIEGKSLNLDKATFYVCTEKGLEVIKKYEELDALFSTQKEFDYSEIKIRE